MISMYVKVSFRIGSGMATTCHKKTSQLRVDIRIVVSDRKKTEEERRGVDMDTQVVVYPGNSMIQ